MEPSTSTSSVAVNNYMKPVNIFYVWYLELCRRMNCPPSPLVKPAKLKSSTVLEFVGDRLKVEDWAPIVNALRHDTSLHVISIKSRLSNGEFLYDVDTEEKAKRMKRRFGSLRTAYVLQQLTKALCHTLKKTEVLNYFELDGVPLDADIIEPLFQALKKNETVKHLSFANTALKDRGCELLCRYLRDVPNVEIINISGCELTPPSGEHLAKFIKYQQINRYCESWHQSLRYGNPVQRPMKGLKRIIMNSNPNFGDVGLDFILEELEDDLWIKAIDLQRCGITDNLGSKVTSIVEKSRSLEIMDLRQNEQLGIEVVLNVVKILHEKQQGGYTPEFQWCESAVTLALESIGGSTFSMGTVLHKTKSAPAKNFTASSAGMSSIRKSRTMDNISKSAAPRNIISELNVKLQSEIQKRESVEKLNEELKQKLEKVESCKEVTQAKSDTKKTLKVVVGSKCALDIKKSTILKHKESKTKNGLASKPLLSATERTSLKLKNGVKRDKRPSNGFKNGISSNANANDKANSLFTSMLGKAGDQEDDDETKNDEELIDYFVNKNCVEPETESQLSAGSQDSLYRYMDQLQSCEANCTIANS